MSGRPTKLQNNNFLCELLDIWQLKGFTVFFTEMFFCNLSSVIHSSLLLSLTSKRTEEFLFLLFTMHHRSLSSQLFYITVGRNS